MQRPVEQFVFNARINNITRIIKLNADEIIDPARIVEKSELKVKKIYFIPI